MSALVCGSEQCGDGDDVRRGAADPLCVAKAGDAVVAPRQMGAQGFYKVWVSDVPIEAE